MGIAGHTIILQVMQYGYGNIDFNVCTWYTFRDVDMRFNNNTDIQIRRQT